MHRHPRHRRHAPGTTAPQPAAARTAALPDASADIRPHAGIPTSAGGPPRNRDEALRQLEEIAAFFRRTEPHSPVAYLAEKAARWGSMSLHEWLRSVVKDDSALLRVEELLGVGEREGHG